MIPHGIRDEVRLALLAVAWIVVVLFRTMYSVHVINWPVWFAGLLMVFALVVGIGWHLRGIVDKRRARKKSLRPPER
jgi:hypothetical protein